MTIRFKFFLPGELTENMSRNFRIRWLFRGEGEGGLAMYSVVLIGLELS